ncbi:caspase family protein [Bacillus thuringiensis]|uniref:caspase family protein n=1 Tax=Bacillus thuringiensis TaxID=1428 RepID=UPI000BFE39C3|nr:caspase family protein [Bacillus thuringiensis]PGM15576.1 hypothetical protein CN938_11165 [Bacillus thuringiensis]
MKKLALIVGINYHGTLRELGGCINDASGFLHKLVQDFNFDSSDIQLLIEEVATRQNIFDGLQWLVGQLDPGDIGVFYYAGHGTQTVDLPPIDEEDMMDEAIVPIDAYSSSIIESNLIRDDEIQEILSKLANDVHFVVVFDSCNSGTATRALKDENKKNSIPHAETIQDIVGIFNNLQEPKPELRYTPRPRSIPPAPATQKVKEIMSNLKVKKRNLSEGHPLSGANHLLLAGCKANQESFDDGIAGYFTSALLESMEKGMTYHDLYTIVREKVLSRDDRQEPQIEGSHLLMNNIFE